MKTAEKWNIIYRTICFNDKAVSGQLLPNPQNVKFIKSVQDDIKDEIKQVVGEMKAGRVNHCDGGVGVKVLTELESKMEKLIEV